MKVKQKIKMKFQIILAIILTLFVAANNAARLGGKGNMRGVATKFSSLSPRQVMLIKQLLQQRQKTKSGRFA